jgi:hypothetical protein
MSGCAYICFSSRWHEKRIFGSGMVVGVGSAMEVDLLRSTLL